MIINFSSQFRTNPIKFEEFLSYLAPLILKASEKREPIGPSERLCGIPGYLITGDAQSTSHSLVTIYAKIRLVQ